MDEWITLRPDQAPTTVQWCLLPMYRTSDVGVDYVWQVGYDGKLIWRTVGPISKTRSTSLEELDHDRAHVLALQMFKKKYLSGYLTGGSEAPRHVKGMKGHIYKPGCVKRWPVILDAKLDGLRMLSTHCGANDVDCHSYGNVSYNHLTDIKDDIIQFMAYLPSYSMLDGELYNHHMGHFGVQSTVRTRIQHHPDVHKLRYYVFDIYWDENPHTEERWSVLASAYQKHIVDVPGTKILLVPKWYAYNEQDIENGKRIAIDQYGFEGVVIRRSGLNCNPTSREYNMCRYSFGRSTRIYKYKDFIDEEGEVVDVIPASGKEADLGVLIIKDAFGKLIPIRHGNEDDRRKWLKDRSLVVKNPPLIFTFKHIGRDPRSNVAQHPTGRWFRDKGE